MLGKLTCTGSMTIDDHYTRSDSRATGKFPRKTLDSMVERGKFKLDKFVNYYSWKGLSAFYIARQCSVCVYICVHAYCSLKCAQLRYECFNGARVNVSAYKRPTIVIEDRERLCNIYNYSTRMYKMEETRNNECSFNSLSVTVQICINYH